MHKHYVIYVGIDTGAREREVLVRPVTSHAHTIREPSTRAHASAYHNTHNTNSKSSSQPSSRYISSSSTSHNPNNNPQSNNNHQYLRVASPTPSSSNPSANSANPQSSQMYPHSSSNDANTAQDPDSQDRDRKGGQAGNKNVTGSGGSQVTFPSPAQTQLFHHQKSMMQLSQTSLASPWTRGAVARILSLSLSLSQLKQSCY